MHIKEAIQIFLFCIGFAVIGFGLGLNKQQPVVEYVYHEVVNEVVVYESQQCINSLDCMMLAEAIYFEARGEPVKGQVAVAHVIMNRVRSNYHPDSISEVIQTRCQFAYQCDGSLKKGITNLPAFRTALIVANKVLTGQYDDPTNGADHYYNPNKMDVNPSWSVEYSQVAQIGQHVFHKRG